MEQQENNIQNDGKKYKSKRLYAIIAVVVGLIAVIIAIFVFIYNRPINTLHRALNNNDI